MQRFKTLADAVALAEFAHRNQFDKAGMPYIEHPKRVMAAVQTQGCMPYVQMAAVLHDVTEDTAFTPAMLLDLGVPEAAVEIVTLLDRDANAELHKQMIIQCHIKNNNGVEYADLETLAWNHNVDEFYYARIRRNPGAVIVKMADTGDNLQPWRLSYLPVVTQDRLRDKYAKAINQLTGN